MVRGRDLPLRRPHRARGRRLGPDPDADHRRARRRRVGHQRSQVVHLGGHRAAYTTCFAITEPEADGHRQFSAIIVPTDTARLPASCGPCRPWATSAASTARSSTTTCGCRTANLLGERGEGFVIAQKRLGPGRIFHCMRWLGQAQRAFELMVDRANTRWAHGSFLSEKGEIQRYVAESAAEIQAARLMTLDAAMAMDTGDEARVEISPHQVLGRDDAAQRDRPGHPGARRARRSPSTRRSSGCTARPATPASTTVPTRCTAWSWPAACCATRRRRRGRWRLTGHGQCGVAPPSSGSFDQHDVAVRRSGDGSL